MHPLGTLRNGVLKLEEMLTIFDSDFTPIGVASRREVHQKGLLHQVAHIWVVSRINGECWLWFQQRAFDKADFPGCFDTAVGGHIAAGEEVLAAAVREMGEEIGLFPQPEQLVYLGDQLEEVQLPGFFSREIARVYLYETPDPPFAPGEEVAQMVRVLLEDYLLFCRGGERISAWTQSGETLTLEHSQWCASPEEFTKRVLPYLCPQVKEEEKC